MFSEIGLLEAVLCCADLGCAVLLSIRLGGACFNRVTYCVHAAALLCRLGDCAQLANGCKGLTAWPSAKLWQALYTVDVLCICISCRAALLRHYVAHVSDPALKKYNLYCMLQVIAVGSGKANEKGDVVKPSLSKGDTVLYQKYSGVDFEGENDRQYVVLKENDILAALV